VDFIGGLSGGGIESSVLDPDDHQVGLRLEGLDLATTEPDYSEDGQAGFGAQQNRFRPQR